MSESTAIQRAGDATSQGPIDALVRRPVLLGLGALLVLASVALLATRYYAFAPVPSIALLLLLLLYRWPEVGFYLVVALVPFGGFRKIEGPFTLNIPWIVAAVLCVVVAIRLLPGKRLPGGLRSSMWGWLLLFLSISLVSACLSRFSSTSFTNIGLLIVAYVFVFLGMTLLSTESMRTWLPGVLVASVSLSSLLAVLGYFLHLPFLAERHGEELVRGVGGAIDPNNMSLMILFVVPLLTHYLVHGRGIVRRAGALGLIALNLAAIVTTFSRGGALMTLVTGLLVGREVVRAVTPRALALLALSMALAAGVFVSWMPHGYWDRLSTLFAWEDTALSRRSTYLVVGRDAALEDPILGSGPGTFRDLYASSEEGRRFPREGKTARRYAHNTYLEVLVGTGLLGLVAFLAALLCADLGFGRAARRLASAGDEEGASALRAYRTSFRVVCLYLLIFSDVYHKYLLLSLSTSQVAGGLPSPPQVVER